MLDGIELGTRAVGHGARYHKRRDRRLTPARPPDLAGAAHSGTPRRRRGVDGAWSARLLEAHGIPLAPAALAKSPAEAAELAASYAQPVAMKFASDQVAHKSDVGGVRLEVEPAQAATTFSELAAALAEHRPGGLLAEVLVGPMRRGGTELLVGVVTDPDWGKVLSVGLGGLWVEVLNDVSLRLLPVDEVVVAEMLAELRAAALLTGTRFDAGGHRAPVPSDRRKRRSCREARPGARHPRGKPASRSMEQTSRCSTRWSCGRKDSYDRE